MWATPRLDSTFTLPLCYLPQPSLGSRMYLAAQSPPGTAVVPRRVYKLTRWILRTCRACWLVGQHQPSSGSAAPVSQTCTSACHTLLLRALLQTASIHRRRVLRAVSLKPPKVRRALRRLLAAQDYECLLIRGASSPAGHYTSSQTRIVLLEHLAQPVALVAELGLEHLQVLFAQRHDRHLLRGQQHVQRVGG
jgi:hypothetical protein